MQGLPGVSPQLRSRPLEGCGAASGTHGGTRLRGATCERRLGSRRVGFLPPPREAQLCLPGAASKPAFGRMGGTFRPRLQLAGLQADKHSGRGPKLGGRRSCEDSEHASCPGRLRPGRARRGRPGSCGWLAGRGGAGGSQPKPRGGAWLEAWSGPGGNTRGVVLEEDLEGASSGSVRRRLRRDVVLEDGTWEGRG